MTPLALTRSAERVAVSTRQGAIARRLERIPAGRRLALTLPAPVAEPEILFDAAAAVRRTASPGHRERLPELQAELDARNHGMLWRPPTGPCFAGVGVALRVGLSGAERFTELGRRADRVFATLDADAQGGAETFTPRAFGGLAFDVGAADEGPWREFGDGCFTLPRWLYRRRRRGADLTLTVGADELAGGGAERWAELTVSLLDALADAEQGSTGPLELPRLLEDPAGDRDWITLVEDIRAAIRRGEVEKIVAARRFTALLGPTRPLARIVERLDQRRRSTAFAFARPGATFLGLTPERLITKDGLHFHTEALAGSIESGAEHAAELLGSGKDRLEQQLVVDAIVRRLEPIAASLEAAERPSVRELPDVLHLHTPITGRLKAPRHVLELAELLHPTPAVGGVPTPDAMAWIRQRENDPRGWYASPVGWFDADGDGELVVALRSCLLLPGRAELFAGAGILADSDPHRELAEVRLKSSTLLRALAS